ncbi:hypothetical protein AAHA92_16439 [Salvia divinorum]|uniref:Secreted protein n=1 Tax=Salvia divinorum TaxID=28513 RepID=A0ABD1GVK0_SALDI
MQTNLVGLLSLCSANDCGGRRQNFEEPYMNRRLNRFRKPSYKTPLTKFTNSPCRISFSECLFELRGEEKWPSRRITPPTTSRTRPTGTESRSPSVTPTPPPKGWILSS